MAKKFEVTIRDLSIWNDLNPSNFTYRIKNINLPKYDRPVPKVNRNDIAYPVKTAIQLIKYLLDLVSLRLDFEVE